MTTLRCFLAGRHSNEPSRVRVRSSPPPCHHPSSSGSAHGRAQGRLNQRDCTAVTLIIPCARSRSTQGAPHATVSSARSWSVSPPRVSLPASSTVLRPPAPRGPVEASSLWLGDPRRQKRSRGEEQLRCASSRKVSLLRHKLEYSAVSIRVARRRSGGTSLSSGEADTTPSDPLQQDEAAHRAPAGSVRRIGNGKCTGVGAERGRQQPTDC